MLVQVVMNRSGDTRHMIDPADAVSMEAARARFEKLTKGGYTAVGFRTLDDQGKALRSFDPNIKKMLFIPQLKGG